MTQEATPETIRGRFDGQMISVAGYPCQPFREGDRFFVSLVHPAWEEQELAAGRDPRQHAQPPPITYEVNRVIGSHHQQVYLSRAPDGAYHTLPIVWQIAEQRWITRKASFLLTHRDSFYHMTKLWNNGCVFCHNTGPEPGLQQSYVAGRQQYSWNTQVAELGIACEACHGPGAAHAEMQQSLAQSPISPADLASRTVLTPSAAKLAADAQSQSLIVNPAKLDKEQSVLTCARCHGKMIAKAEFDRQCLVEGDFFRPGQWDFVERYNYPTRDPQAEFAEMKDGMYFWADGTPRTTALEYQGVLQSACYQRGEMTCLSCHSMHNSPPNDQLRYGDDPGLEVSLQNEACNQCHPQFKDPVQLEAHTHHAPASSGSLCYNCHMPYQSYSLLKRTRSHRISNPSPSLTAETGMPNACNQCHVDQTLQWANETLAKWQGAAPTQLPERFPGRSQTVSDALAGNALQRALAIEQLGDSENFALAASAWRADILIELLEDEFEANRLLAYRALQKLAGFEDLQFDYIAPAEQRAVSIAEAHKRLSATDSDSKRARLQAVLGGTAEQDPAALIDELVRQRIDVDMQVLE